ncbi:MAG: glycosyltransferase family 2 protein [Actinomycetota bacterium]|nr:glycosyltransferase family 2 protein [Actinomycetota bacterium]
MNDLIDLCYILPLKWTDDLDRDEMTSYLKRLSDAVAEVVVVDGSAPEHFSANAAAWGPYVKHLAVDSDLSFKNGKVNGVVTGVRAAGFEKVVIADDDVRYEAGSLHRVADLLEDADLVRPQNFFKSPMPWHATWDTARTLLNRSFWVDYPGTLAVRRSLFLAMGGYDGNVMFENLELIRTVARRGGREVAPLDLYVERRPPTTRLFFSQRVRQAYDDFAQPRRMAVELSMLPAVALLARRRRVRAGVAATGVVVATAEIGRRRAGGVKVFSPAASLLAPAWLLERGICIWLALYQRATGGVRYSGGKIPKAANPP